MLKDNDCTKCPAYYFSQDYWGDVDEYCLIRDYDYFSNGCRLPIIVRKIKMWVLGQRERIAGIRMERALNKGQKCRVCGCTWYNPCAGGCYWVEEDLCSQCRDEMD